jgi:hypothetical protein
MVLVGEVGIYIWRDPDTLSEALMWPFYPKSVRQMGLLRDFWKWHQKW